MKILDGITSGAGFVRADLHVHSYGPGGSYDVKDATMTPEAIVDEAVAKSLSVISITDHNEIENVKLALAHATGKPILVVPGIEVSTPQGHLLVYFGSFKDLQAFHGKLSISADRVTCDQGIVQCLDFAQQLDGFGILAHIDLSSGFDQMMGQRYNQHMANILSHKALSGMEICKKESSILFTSSDADSRKDLAAQRRVALGQHDDVDLPKFMSSDSHTLLRLGTNADGDEKVTRIKLDSLTYSSLKVALANSSSRIRLEESIPERIPRFVGMRLQGGLLDGQVVRFSNNLTCIIGGRGAGKSTLLESLKGASGNTSAASVVDSDVWPHEITLLYEDETGQLHTLRREKNGDVYNVENPSHGITKIPIECYGQGETASTLQFSEDNPQILIDLLDTFIPALEPLKREESEIREALLENQSESTKCRIEVLNIPEIEKQKAINGAKLAQLKKDKAGELVKSQSALLKEREIRSNIQTDLRALVIRYKDILADSSVFEDFNSLSDDEIFIGKDYFGKVKKLVSDFSSIVASKSSELNVSLDAKIGELAQQLKEWADREKQIHEDIEAKKIDLEEKGIPFDIGKINQIAKNDIAFTERLKKLRLKEKTWERLKRERSALLKQRAAVKERIYLLRAAFGKEIDENLKQTVDGLLVSVKYEQGVYSPLFEEQIKTTMGWRTSLVPKARYLARFISPLAFADLVKRGKLAVLKKVVDADAGRVFSDEEITNIQKRIFENNGYEEFETVSYDDRPSIKVTKQVVDEDGSSKMITKSLSQLSLGQQQSILLAILLQSKSRVPLLIDQPEDNLDSEFIYKTIVANLRSIKEGRQVIIVTHNANIAILGDAELIIPLKSTNIKSVVTEPGSIDRTETNSLCCEILEGGRAAFLRRKDIYGIS